MSARAVNILLAAAALSLAGCAPPGGPPAAAEVGAPALGGVPPMPRQVVLAEPRGVRVEEVARDLEIPWAIAFASDGRSFFTERPGRIRVMRRGESPRRYLDLDSVVHRGEGGLMGLALHPRFPRQPYLYVMSTSACGN